MKHFTPMSTEIPDLLFLNGDKRFFDQRGWFSRVYEHKLIDVPGWNDFELCQVNMSLSLNAVLRGLHAQPKMRKILWVASGAIYDVILDLRFPKIAWTGLYIQAGEGVAIPAGCAHGFQVVSSWASIMYMIDQPHDPQAEVGYRWNDPAFNIWWPLMPPILSDKDKEHPLV